MFFPCYIEVVCYRHTSRYVYDVRVGTCTCTSRGYLFRLFRVRAARTKHLVPHDVYYYVLFKIVFWGTLLRPIAGAVMSTWYIPNSTLRNVLCVRAHTGKKSWASSSWSSTATSALRIA